MKVYKLTDQQHRTFNNTHWGPGVTHTTSGKGPLCSQGWLHFYTHPLLAVILNPIHAVIPEPVLWEGIAEGNFLFDFGIKGGCTKLTTVQTIDLPVVTAEQRVRFAILCVLETAVTPEFKSWAEGWLRGENRTVCSGTAMRQLLGPVCGTTAAWAAAESAGWLARWTEAMQALSTEQQAVVKYLKPLNDSAEWAAQSAEWAARSSDSPLDLITLAEKAINIP